MKQRWHILIGVTVVANLAVMVFAPLVTSQSQLSGSVRVDGSSTVYPLTEAVAEEFSKQHRRVRVTVGFSGTGGGFKKFARGEIDIGGASRPIKPTEAAECRRNNISYIELPVAYDAIAVVVNPTNTWTKVLTGSELKRIWEPKAQGKVTNWSQVRKGFPNRPLRLFGPGIDSGTFDYFTEFVCGKSGASRGDYASSENDNVLVQGVAGDPNGLGYFGFAYYAENQSRLKAVAIQHPDYNDGKPCLPSEKAVIENRYPLARPLFIYVNRQSVNRPEVGAFVEFYLKNAASLAKEVRYVPLPKRAYQLAMERFKKRITGTVFGKGLRVGISVEELLKAETKKAK